MANRYSRQFTASNVPAVNHVYASVSFGAAGAPTLVNGNAGYVSSITRNGTGDYTIVFADQWPALLSVSAVFNAGSSAPAAPLISIKTNSVATLNTQSLRILTIDVAGAAADPASGEIVYLDFVFRNSSITF